MMATFFSGERRPLVAVETERDMKGFVRFIAQGSRR